MKSAQFATFKRSALKLALVSAFALGASVMGVNSYAATATGTATATVIVPIAVSTTNSLVFGSFAHGAGGAVTVNTNGSRTTTGPILSTIGATPAAAIFAVTGDGSSTYSITTTGTAATIASNAVNTDTMLFAHCTALTAAATCVPGNNVTTGALTTGAQNIYMGGTLTVGAGQVAHQDYTGAISVTVEYN